MDQSDLQAVAALRGELTGRAVLLLEDDPVFAQRVVEQLKPYGLARVDLFERGEAALNAALNHCYDVLLLDRDNPGMEGLQVLREIRDSAGPSRNALALMITNLGQPSHRSQGMLVGADDYLAKGVEELELVARIAARLRRSGQPNPFLVNGPLKIDVLAKAVSLAGKSVDLTGKEFRILLTLAGSVGLPVTKSMLFKQCWPNQSLNTVGWENTVFQRTRDLRKTLEPHEERCLPPSLIPLVINVRGEGYLMRDLSRFGALDRAPQ